METSKTINIQISSRSDDDLNAIESIVRDYIKGLLQDSRLEGFKIERYTNIFFQK